MDPQVPLVVPEINPEATADALLGRGMISSPNCSTMALVMALAPLHREDGRAPGRLHLPVGLGHRQRRSRSSAPSLTPSSPGRVRPPPAVYPHQIAFNVLPQVESFRDGDGYTTEERKVMDETRKILGLGGEAPRRRHVRARARVRRSLRVGPRPDPRALSLERCPRGPDQIVRASVGRRSRDAGTPSRSTPPTATTSSSDGIRRDPGPPSALSTSGSSATTYARAPPPTPSR